MSHRVEIHINLSVWGVISNLKGTRPPNIQDLDPTDDIYEDKARSIRKYLRRIEYNHMDRH